MGFVNNFTMKNCDRIKVKTITVKNSKKSLKKVFTFHKDQPRLSFVIDS